MNIRKMSKIISVVLILTTILSAFSMVFATTAGPAIPSPTAPTGASQVSSIAGMVIYVIQIIAFAAAVIMLIFVGIKFLTASPEGKAEVKKTAVIYVVGAILLFAATGILSLVRTLASNLNNSTVG